MMNPDSASLSFSTGNLFFLNLCLGFIMFGVALHLKKNDFEVIWQQPKLVFLGLLSQLLLLPVFTFLLVYLLQPHPSLALGMILVAACPGGTISNYITHLAGGNVALSVSLTSIVTLLSVFSTPFNFSFWGSFLSDSGRLSAQIHLNFWEMAQTIVWLIVLPIFLGFLCLHYLPKVAEKLRRPIQSLSLLIFIAFIFIAFYNNFQIFINYFQSIFGLVLLHNALALFLGWGIGKLGRVSEAEVKTLSIETGIQNSGLGLVLIFNFFDGLGGMALIAAWWGLWHIVSGLCLAWFWKNNTDLLGKPRL